MEKDFCPEKDTLILRGTLTKKEFTKHGDYHFKKILHTIFLSFMIFSFLTYVIATWNAEDLDDVFSYIFFALFSLILSSVLLIGLKIITKLKAYREYKSDPLVKREITYIISSQEIHQKIGKSNNYLEWEQIRTAYENTEMFRLYVSRAKAIVLPKRYFASEEEIQLLKRLITKNLSKDKVKF
jgi:YcxB-like protein